MVTKDGEAPYDEDCDLLIDEDDTVLCDDNLAVEDEDPFAAVRAMELCKTSMGAKDWGVVSGKWVLADGTEPFSGIVQTFHLGHGILDGFGPSVTTQAGVRMFALSSGTARQPTDVGYKDVGGFPKGFTCAHPQGFPKESPACPGSLTGQPNDSAGLEIEILPPSNATGFSFDFKFYTYEWPNYVCSTFNDFFVALLMPFPSAPDRRQHRLRQDGQPRQREQRLHRGMRLRRQPAQPVPGGRQGLRLPPRRPRPDPDRLRLRRVRVLPGSRRHELAPHHRSHRAQGEKITVRWAVYDSGDGVLDTTTLIDNFKWIAAPGVTVGTDIVPE